MTLRRSKFPRATPAVLTLATGLGLTAALSLPGNAGNMPVTCQAVLSDRGGMVEIAGFVETLQSAYGTYEMEIRSAAGNSISQAGDFETFANQRIELSQAMLSGRASGHSVKLRVRVGGKTYICPSSDQQI